MQLATVELSTAQLAPIVVLLRRLLHLCPGQPDSEALRRDRPVSRKTRQVRTMHSDHRRRQLLPPTRTRLPIRIEMPLARVPGWRRIAPLPAILPTATAREGAILTTTWVPVALSVEEASIQLQDPQEEVSPLRLRTTLSFRAGLPLRRPAPTMRLRMTIRCLHQRPAGEAQVEATRRRLEQSRMPMPLRTHSRRRPTLRRARDRLLRRHRNLVTALGMMTRCRPIATQARFRPTRFRQPRLGRLEMCMDGMRDRPTRSGARLPIALTRRLTRTPATLVSDKAVRSRNPKLTKSPCNSFA